MLRSTLFLFFAIACRHFQIAQGGLSEAAVEANDVLTMDIRAPTDPGKSYATILVPAYTHLDKLFVDCITFFAGSPTAFDIGSTPVICLAQDSPAVVISFNVFVFDCEAPTFVHCDLVRNKAIAADGETSAAVTYTPPPATDNDGSAPAVVCDPAPGSIFAIGVTPIKCTATDQAGNAIGIATHQVVVESAAPIVPAPDIPCGPHEMKSDDDGSCQACPNGKVPNAANTACVFCQKGQVRGNQEGSAESGCVFAHGICDVWEKGVNGKCKNCPAGKIGKEDERGCIFCPRGTVRGNSAGDLLSECIPAADICDTNEIGVGGKCVACGTGEVPNALFAQCVSERL